MGRPKTIVFIMNGITLADLWLKARMNDIGLNEQIVYQYADVIEKKTKSQLILPKIDGISQEWAETIVGSNMSKYFVPKYYNFLEISV